ncbi:DUF2341 domain-containing protein [Bacillus toyonensis]|uniref:DUF2341 domain-containing protein n=1 Tax=Bacillus toyonensis TaxID=155322 RepID=UPI002E1FD425|nr:DUF2341 domain-containing protein [Bacillus toyonensis]
MSEERGGIVEYVILLAAMGVCSVLIFPSLRTQMVEWNNTMICNVTKSIGSGGKCGDSTTSGGNDGFNTENPGTSNPNPPVTGGGDDQSAVKVTLKKVSLQKSIQFVGQQISVHLNASNFDYTKSKSSGKDILFYDEKGTKLPSFIEKWDASGESVIWVKTAVTGTKELEIKLDSKGSSENDPHKVFDFYEDFSKPLDKNRWIVPAGYENNIKVGGGVLNIKDAHITLKNTFGVKNKTFSVIARDVVKSKTGRRLMFVENTNAALNKQKMHVIEVGIKSRTVDGIKYNEGLDYGWLNNGGKSYAAIGWNILFPTTGWTSFGTTILDGDQIALYTFGEDTTYTQKPTANYDAGINIESVALGNKINDEDSGTESEYEQFTIRTGEDVKNTVKDVTK